MKRNDQYEDSARLVFFSVIGIVVIIILMKLLN